MKSLLSRYIKTIPISQRRVAGSILEKYVSVDSFNTKQEYLTAVEQFIGSTAEKNPIPIVAKNLLVLTALSKASAEPLNTYFLIVAGDVAGLFEEFDELLSIIDRHNIIFEEQILNKLEKSMRKLFSKRIYTLSKVSEDGMNKNLKIEPKLSD